MNTMPRPTSNQAAFDNAWQWYFEQHHSRAILRGSNGTYACLYRTADEANGCAIGCQLPDELVPEIQGISIHCLLAEDLKVRDWFANCSQDFLIELQAVHDNGPDEDFMKHMIELADKYHLQVPTK